MKHTLYIIVGVLSAILGIAASIYIGIWSLFIGGIFSLIDGAIILGIVKLVLCIPITAMIAIGGATIGFWYIFKSLDFDSLVSIITDVYSHAMKTMSRTEKNIFKAITDAVDENKKED